MAQLVIDNLEDDVKAKLADLARDHGRSVAEEVRDILRGAVVEKQDTETNLGTRLADRFASCGLDEEIQEWRGQPIRPASFDL